MEIWKDVEGFEGLYQVSNHGRILSLRKKGDKIIKLSCKRYLKFVAYNSGSYKNLEVHRVVAKSFVDGYFEGAVVNHKNGIKTDNRPINLEWVTVKRNNEHARDTGLLNPPKGEEHFNSKWVLNLQTGIFYETVTEAAKVYGITKATMSQYLNGYFKKTIPFVFV